MNERGATSPERSGANSVRRMPPANWSTPRLTMRPPRLEDAEPIFSGWASNTTVTRFLTWRPHQQVQDTREFLQQSLAAGTSRSTERRIWVITRFDDDRPIGTIELRLSGHRAEVGYALAEPAWGQGIMTEVVQTLTQMVLHESKVARVEAVCDVENLASARVLEKTGMLREGRMRRHTVHPNVSDQPRDVYLYARTRPLQAEMHQADVLDVLDAFQSRTIQVWVGGGWGIDALIGHKTRDHSDLDLASPAEHEATVIDVLVQRGYRIVLDYRPARVALADDDGREVDLHTVRFDQRGHGVQAGLRGEEFLYPPDAFSFGRIGGHRVACLSAEQQIRFHTGYELRERDHQDLAKLRAAIQAH
jgi:RimJ/RimL family protein N-acetyltransferase